MVSLPFTDPVAAPAVRTPQLKIQTLQASSSGLGGLADVATSLLGGNSGPDPWATHLISMRMQLALGDHVDHVILQVLETEQAPDTALGTTLSIALSFDDGEEIDLFTGNIQRQETLLAGYRRVLVSSPLLQLSQQRLNSSFEEQSAKDIIQSLLAETDVAAGTIDSGERYPFYVVSDRQTLLQHIQVIAELQNWLCYAAADGSLNAHALNNAEQAKVFAYGSDIIAMTHRTQNLAQAGVKVVGSGAATSNGADAWNWLSKEPKTLAESGASGEVFSASSLRDTTSAENFSAALGAKSARASNRVQLQTTAAPEVLPGSAFEIQSAPNAAANAIYVAERVTISFDRQTGFVSHIDGFNREAGAASLGGALGGLL